jgi:uncharacterized protein YbaA (DUF1428 family)
MAHYVDGYVIPVPKKKLSAYRRMAALAGKVWREHGALDYKECVGDDLEVDHGMVPFPRLAKSKSGEAVVFSWVLFKSRAHRNQVNKRVMKDPRILAMCGPDKAPFDVKRMAYGGFKTIVEA